jgi:MFS transporter, Spinster family, sphingosine-1-phosphate transporter
LGESEPELKELIKKGYEYNYTIESKQLLMIASKASNIWLFLQGFFMNITTGTLIWLPTLYISKIEHQGYSTETSIITSGYLFALLQLGGLTSAFFGYLGDLFQRRTYRGRALMTAIIVLMAMPLYVAMFMIPMNDLALPDSYNPVSIFLSLIKNIATNRWMFTMFLLSFLATAAQSANTPNWLALITDVNLPEHRATIFSAANLINGLGRTLGSVGIGFVLAHISMSYEEPKSYIITLILFQIFLIPSAFCYFKMAKNNVTDIKKVKSTLRRRSKLT